jgi:hypothetical protein
MIFGNTQLMNVVLDMAGAQTMNKMHLLSYEGVTIGEYCAAVLSISKHLTLMFAFALCRNLA